MRGRLFWSVIQTPSLATHTRHTATYASTSVQLVNKIRALAVNLPFPSALAERGQRPPLHSHRSVSWRHRAIAIAQSSGCSLRCSGIRVVRSLLKRLYLHAGGWRRAGGQRGHGGLCRQWVGGVAAGGVSAFPVGLQVISHVLTCILQLVLVEDDVKHLLTKGGGGVQPEVNEHTRSDTSRARRFNRQQSSTIVP